jgi:Mrp family chromosome partitioning ATPase
MAQALEGGAVEKPPWYEPLDNLPDEAVIKPSSKMELDSLVVDAPPTKAKADKKLLSTVPK